ncbi:hypothetical protein J7M23_06440 [Candidatus Sumerlaeota bacterium]|nr:hypothetical protein [Candidatus Sumerlaeota bacterium]
MKSGISRLLITLLIFCSGSVLPSAVAQEIAEGSEPYYSAPELTEPLSSVTEPGLLSKSHKELEGIENCTKCHPTGSSPGTAKCLECHSEIKERWDKEVGYHGKFLKGNCIECHKEHKGIDVSIIQFDRLTFNHNLALFPLEGKHRSLQCEACHLLKSGETGTLGFRYMGLPQECYQCHSTPHGGEVDLNCLRCHTQQGWTGRHIVFNHNRDASFKLRGAHIEVKCEKCHPNKVYKPRPRDCAGCHKDPHQQQLGTDCARCHNEWRWSDARYQFNHDTQTSFSLLGKHKDLKCTQCHSAKFKDTPTQCVACHQDVHNDKFGQDCAKCHNQWSWQVVDSEKFNHSIHTGFALTGKHTALACSRCHPKQGAVKVRGKNCVDCHPDIYHRKELGNKCERCHNTRSWKIQPAEFNHKKLAKFELGSLHSGLECNACHQEKGKFKGLSSTCESCHKRETQFLAGISIFDDLTTMPSSMHNTVRCQDCHSVSDTPKDITPISQRCSKCHPASYKEVCRYWVTELDKESDSLQLQLAELKTFVKRHATDTDTTLTPLNMTFYLFTDYIDQVTKVIHRLREGGFHNLGLSIKEFEYAERLLEQLRDFVQREMKKSSHEEFSTTNK